MRIFLRSCLITFAVNLYTRICETALYWPHEKQQIIYYVLCFISGAIMAPYIWEKQNER